MGQEEGLGDLQASQPHLNPWEGDGATNPGNYFQTFEELLHHRRSAWIHKGKKSCLTKLVTLCD